MKTEGLRIALILLLAVAFTGCGNQSANEATGPSATYEGTLEVTGTHVADAETYTVLYRYEISNTNDIGGTVDNIKHELTIQDGLLNEETYIPEPAIYIPGNGSHSWEVTEELEFTGLLPEAAIVTIKVIDDNNNDHFLATDYTAIDWI